MSMSDGGEYSLDAAIEHAGEMLAAAKKWKTLIAAGNPTVEQLQDAGAELALLAEHVGNLLEDAAE
ncbi:hypothetical protein [Nocardia niwae]|uniref:hypothetical protein n=1 Tax=Nocardia niwae TaxID=626084 RepID=UPI0033F2E14F